MNPKIKAIGYLTIGGAVVSLVSAYFTDTTFWQSTLISLGTTLLGLGLAILLVNHTLLSSDKKLAAGPVLKLISPNMSKLHNELFLNHLHEKLGKNQFQELLKIYQDHKRDPRAFSPEQRDVLHGAIISRRDEILAVHDLLQEQFRELTALLGWSFDSTIVGAALDARISFATFRGASSDTSDDSKRSVIESFLDGEAAAFKVLERLAEHFGLEENQYQSEG